ncbi:MAG: insulinase family protein [Clostridia bacterium]|nr:insulinase family protein [Clostridia bacterium]
MEKIVLENGLRLLLLPQSEARVFTLDVWVGAGSRYEAGFHGGISHLAEHMLFKGTETRTSRDISLAMDDIGGVINAYTGQEHTRYYIKTLREFAGQALELLADMLLHSAIPQKELELERMVVLEEIAMYEDSPEDTAHDGLTEMVWQGGALGAPISGTRESVLAIDREELLRFLHERYTPDNMLVVCAGGFDEAAVRAAVEATFGHRPTGTGHPVDDTPVFVPGILRREKPYEQVSLELGFPGLPVDASERFTLSLLTALLGDGESSRLYQRLREELGLVYGVFTTHYASRDVGMYTISASTSPDNQLTVLQEIGEVLTHFLTEEITAEELRRTKTRVKTSFLMSLETVAALAAREGRSEWVLGRSVPVEDVLAAWEAVTAEDILVLARRLFAGPVALAAVGPAAEEAVLRQVLATFPGEKFGAC